jgi:hypothetical protein
VAVNPLARERGGPHRRAVCDGRRPHGFIKRLYRPR